MDKLISMTAFILEYYPKGLKPFFYHNYAEFLSQPLTLGMFVPCDLVGNVLEKPNPNKVDYLFYIKQYQEAKSKVLFEGFKYEKTIWNIADLIHLGKKENIEFVKNEDSFILMINEFKDRNIEDVVNYQLTLTETSKKQIGL